MADRHVPRRARFIFDHSHVHVEPELVWTQTLQKQLEDRDSDCEG